MRKTLAIVVIAALVVTAFSGVLALAAPAPVANAQAATVVYNLYATDGYVEMADGEAVYTYGFVGGRQGVDLTYQTSFCTGDGIGRSCGGSANVLVPGGAPAPTGGPWSGIDAQLAGNAQFPAPIIYASVGDIVEIRLKNLGVAANLNAPNDPHSIHLHGLDVDAANDGVPETSVAAVPANLCLDGITATDCSFNGGPAPGAGNVVVYMVSPLHEGTSMYHCHQEANIHVNMGMYGAFVTYNPLDAAALTGPGKGAGGNYMGFPYDKDYILLLSEFDVRGHEDEEGTYAPNTWDPDLYNWADYQPQYWFINGISFPQTIHAGFPSGNTYANWIAAHPGYETLYTGSISTPPSSTFDWQRPGDKVLLRVINLGFETQPMHMHGYHGKILGGDQRVWDWANKPGNTSVKNPKPPTPFGMGLEKNTLLIGSGETYEWLIDFGQQKFQSTYPIGTQSCYDPFTNLPVPNAVGCTPIPANGVPNAGASYVGGPVVSGLEGAAPNADFAGFGTSQYFPFHNHDDYKATNDGSYPGGMFTMLVPTP